MLETYTCSPIKPSQVDGSTLLYNLSPIILFNFKTFWSLTNYFVVLGADLALILLECMKGTGIEQDEAILFRLIL